MHACILVGSPSTNRRWRTARSSNGGSQQEADFEVSQPVGSVYFDPVRVLELLQHVDAVCRTSGLEKEARHPRPLPVRGHGGCGALRQLHVLRGEEEVVCDGRCRTAGPQHLRSVRWRAGVLRGLAQGTDVFQSAGRHWRLSGSGQRGGGGLQTETSQQVPAVYRTSFPGSLPHLHGVLPPAQQRGPAGLSEPHRGRRDHSDPAAGLVRGSGSGLPLRLLRPPGGAGPGHRPASGDPAHRRQPGLLAPHPQGGVLEPDEADRTQRGHLRRRADPGHRRLNPPGSPGSRGAKCYRPESSAQDAVVESPRQRLTLYFKAAVAQ